MENPEKKATSLSTLLADAKDPNEYIEANRTVMAEESQMAKDDIFPLPLDSAGDLVEGFAGTWLLMCAPLPIRTKENVTDLLNELIEQIRKKQDHLPSDELALQVDLLRCLRKGKAR